MIENWGTWTEFQELLRTLDSIAATHSVSLTNVAMRWGLNQRSVGAVIVGTRLGVSLRVEDNLKVFHLRLSETQMATIDLGALGTDGEKSRRLLEKLGDCGQEYSSMH